MAKQTAIRIDGNDLKFQIVRSSLTLEQLSLLIGKSANYLSNACNRNAISEDCIKKLEVAGFNIKLEEESSNRASDDLEKRIEDAVYRAVAKLKKDIVDSPDEKEEVQPDPYTKTIQWIPCFVSLPRTSENVLVTEDFYSKSEGAFTRTVFMAKYENGVWKKGQKEIYNEIYAWAKFPEAYTE